MISNGLLVFFSNKSKNSFRRQFCQKQHAICPTFEKKNSFFTVTFFEFFAVLEHQTLEFRQHDNRRVSKTLLSVATGTF